METYTDLATLLEKAAELVRKQGEENEALRAREAEREANRRKWGMLADLPDILTAKEIATFLRMRPTTVYEMFRAGKIKSFGGGVNGKSIRCMKADFIDWLENERNRAPGQPREEYAIPEKIQRGRRLKVV
jgi:hypothetical protein